MRRERSGVCRRLFSSVYPPAVVVWQVTSTEIYEHITDVYSCRISTKAWSRVLVMIESKGVVAALRKDCNRKNRKMIEKRQGGSFSRRSGSGKLVVNMRQSWANIVTCCSGSNSCCTYMWCTARARTAVHLVYIYRLCGLLLSMRCPLLRQI